MIVKADSPTFIAKKLVSVQPMTPPSGIVFNVQLGGTFLGGHNYRNKAGYIICCYHEESDYIYWFNSSGDHFLHYFAAYTPAKPYKSIKTAQNVLRKNKKKFYTMDNDNSTIKYCYDNAAIIYKPAELKSRSGILNDIKRYHRMKKLQEHLNAE